MKRKKIVFVSPYGHFGGHSGARKRFENLCHALGGNEDLHLTALSPARPPGVDEHIEFSMDGSFLRRLLELARLNAILHKLAPDLVISESPLAPFAFGRFAIFHVIHDAKFATEMGRRGARLAKLFHWMSARLADRIVTVSNSEKARLVAALGIRDGKVLVSYNGLSEQWCTALCSSATREFDILFVSNFAKHKGHTALLEALAGHSYKIAFVGTDTYGEMAECKHFALQNAMDVSFISGLSEAELISVYDRSRMFVFPSRLEGFGMPYLEARARGLPCLVSDIEVFRELQQLIGGTVVDFSDHRAVREAVANLVQAERHAPDVRDFSWSHIARDLVQAAGWSSRP